MLAMLVAAAGERELQAAGGRTCAAVSTFKHSWSSYGLFGIELRQYCFTEKHSGPMIRAYMAYSTGFLVCLQMWGEPTFCLPRNHQNMLRN